MRIALLSFHFAEYAVRLAQALCRDHEILLILSERNLHNELSVTKNLLESPGLQVEAVADLHLWDPGMWRQAGHLYTRLKRFAPDVIHCQEVYRDYLPLALPGLSSIPIVLTIHDHQPHSGQRAVQLRSRMFLRWLRQRADAIIVHSQSIGEECLQLFPEWAHRLYAVPHGPLGDIGRTFSVDWQPGEILFFGRMESYKGLSFLIQAAHILKARGVSVRMTVAGTGPDLTMRKHTIEADPAFVVHDRFILRHELDALFQRANVVALPYTDATQSGIAALALHYGRPVVASDVGAINQLVRHNFNGILVPPKNPVALADALEKVISDEPLAVSFARNAVQLATGELSWTRIASDTTKVYANVQSRRVSDGSSCPLLSNLKR